jgi:hypothetical protein
LEKRHLRRRVDDPLIEESDRSKRVEIHVALTIQVIRVPADFRLLIDCVTVLRTSLRKPSGISPRNYLGCGERPVEINNTYPADFRLLIGCVTVPAQNKYFSKIDIYS